MSNYRWLTELSQHFLDRDYLVDGQTTDERVTEICQAAEKILGKPGFADKFKSYFQKGWFSFSTPIWTNFGNDRGLPISCFGSFIEDNCESIAGTWHEVFMMTKHGGGTSAYFGNLRERGAKIKKNGESSGSVHFMQAFDNLINVVSQGKCYIEGTQVLTNNGFKDFRDVLETDKLAELDEYNNISFTNNYELVVEDFDGELVCLSGVTPASPACLKVTPNHRMVVNQRHVEGNKRYWSAETEIVLAKDLKMHRDNRLVLAGWAGSGSGITNFDRLRIAYQSDGIKDLLQSKILFSFSYHEKFKRIVEILDGLGISYNAEMGDCGTYDVSIEFIKSVAKEKFDEWVNIETISGQWAEEFLEELSYWSGNKNNDGSITFCSYENFSDVELIQAVAAMANRKTSVSRTTDFSTTINISDSAYRTGDTVKVTHESYNGKVYCAVVPKGRLVVKYNDNVTVCGNTRRGNFAAYLPIDHADVMEFLQIRSEGAPIQDLSYGVCVPDYWMEEMIGDGTPEGGDKKKRAVWAKVLECRSNFGFPYIVFIDTANKNTVDCYKDKNMKIWHSNLCTEIFLANNKDESFVCDLSSMNDLYFDEWKDTDAVEMLTYFLDAVMSEFIVKASKIDYMHRTVKFAERHRALGIGQIGWHSYLQSKMIPFESTEAKILNVKIAKTIKEQAYAASAKLAQEYGEPDVCKGYGRRNSTLIAIAPTKSSAFIIGQVSECVEPERANIIIKDLQKGKYTLKNKYLEELLITKNKNTEEVWYDILKHGGSVQHLDFLSNLEKSVFKTFGEITQKEVIIQAAQRQRYIDQGQSLNIMIHPSIPIKDVNMLMIEAWKMGIKSLYYQYSVNAAQQFSRQILDCVSCQG